MDSIVEKLSEIESAATNIVEHAESQKEVLEQEMRTKREQFDAELEAKTQQKIQVIRDDLAQKTSEILKGQTGSNDSVIETLKSDFEANHTAYAKEILKRITEV